MPNFNFVFTLLLVAALFSNPGRPDFSSHIPLFNTGHKGRRVMGANAQPTYGAQVRHSGHSAHIPSKKAFLKGEALEKAGTTIPLTQKTVVDDGDFSPDGRVRNRESCRLPDHFHVFPCFPKRQKANKRDGKLREKGGGGGVQNGHPARLTFARFAACIAMATVLGYFGFTRKKKKKNR